ncbi:MAG: helix-turn-helix transcriptional regulator [Geodermatophilaceae bacterium]|nr:helix-turn-helix transcriptional regulator [Geodermatophilaceae bacterium]
MGRGEEATNRAILRVRDAIDRDYPRPLDTAAQAALVPVSPAHLIRTFRAVFGETPHRYLQRRRVERAMFLLRNGDLPVLEVRVAVGFTSLGTFGRTFQRVVGERPTAYRRRSRGLHETDPGNLLPGSQCGEPDVDLRQMPAEPYPTCPTSPPDVLPDLGRSYPTLCGPVGPPTIG